MESTEPCGPLGKGGRNLEGRNSRYLSYKHLGKPTPFFKLCSNCQHQGSGLLCGKNQQMDSQRSWYLDGQLILVYGSWAMEVSWPRPLSPHTWPRPCCFAQLSTFILLPQTPKGDPPGPHENEARFSPTKGKPLHTIKCDNAQNGCWSNSDRKSARY